MTGTLTANNQFSHAAWSDSRAAPVREERFTYDKNQNITSRQGWFSGVMESESCQRQQHGRVVSRGDRERRHTAHRIHPESGMPERGSFVQVIRDELTSWQYDVNGRLAEKRSERQGGRAQQWRYRWNARSQLTGLEKPDGERWEYKYDPFGRRISKRCVNRDKAGMDFHWNGDLMVGEVPVSADGTPQENKEVRWYYVPGSFTPLARYENGELHYAVADTVGRIQELVKEDGEIVWRGEQQLWGRETGFQREGAPGCRLRFAGQYEDEESGLYYNRHRYYDCVTGQYLSADPVGLAGGLNPYAYVPNPLKYVDPLGLAKECCNLQFRSRNEAFRAAKRDAGIPMNQHPTAAKKVQLTDIDGHAIKDSDFNILESREYHYTRPDGSRVVIQEHSAGHTYGPPGTPGNQGPHFNTRPLDPKTGNGSRNGSVSGTYDHYEFPGGL